MLRRVCGDESGRSLLQLPVRVRGPPTPQCVASATLDLILRKLRKARRPTQRNDLPRFVTNDEWALQTRGILGTYVHEPAL